LYGSEKEHTSADLNNGSCLKSIFNGKGGTQYLLGQCYAIESAEVYKSFWNFQLIAQNETNCGNCLLWPLQLLTSEFQFEQNAWVLGWITFRPISVSLNGENTLKTHLGVFK